MVINHKDKTIEERLKESKKVFEKYPDRLCIYIEKSEKCKIVNNLEKNKYIIPNTISVAEFIVIIRKRINITSEHREDRITQSLTRGIHIHHYIYIYMYKLVKPKFWSLRFSFKYFPHYGSTFWNSLGT